MVEPDVLARMVISDYLRECGYKVLEAIGSEEAMEILKTDSKVDAVFSEVKLEGMDGFELSHWIRSNRPEIEVILTSGPTKAAEKAGDLCDEGPSTSHTIPSRSSGASRSCLKGGAKESHKT